MNKFNIRIICLIAAVSLATQVASAQQPEAQHRHERELEAALRHIGQLANGIGMEMAEQLAAMSEIEAERIASQIEKIDFKALVQQAEVLGGESGTNGNFAYQKEKIIEKVYPVNDSHTLSIDNRYGKIKVHNWNRNEVKVTVKIRTSEGSERKAQETLDRVRIDESRSGKDISFKTHIESGYSGWWSTLTSGGNTHALNIDYEVYLPKKNVLALANSYGSIEVGDRDGNVDISVSYGSLTAGRLSGKDNSLSVAYSKAEVDYLNEGDVSVRYGGFTLGEAEKLNLALSYTSDSKIAQVRSEADVSLRYSGGFQMGLGPNLRKASVSAAYSNVHVIPATNSAFNFDVSISYGGFDYDQNRVTFQNRSEHSTSKSYTGYWNKPQQNAVSISSRYGKVSLK